MFVNSSDLAEGSKQSGIVEAGTYGHVLIQAWGSG